MEDAPALVETVRRYAEAHALLPPEGARVVVGLSGGVDSVVLAHVLRDMGYAVTAAHVNYGLREAAAGDEALVRRYGASFEPPVPVRVARRDAQAEADRRSASLQAVAREQRYAFFARVAAAAGAGHVAVGHHRDDQAETLLLNLARGCGPEGLAGMPPKRRLGARGRAEAGRGGEASARTGAWLVRPLLAAGREAIEAYAEARALPWREDRSNRDARFKRAAMRRDVLPALEAHFPGASERLARSAALMRGYVDDALRPALRRRFDGASGGGTPGSHALRLDALRGAAPVWQGRLLLEALRRWCPGAPRSQAVARELRGLLDAQPGRRVELGAWRVWREREALRFTDAVEEPGRPQALTPERPAHFPGGTVRAEVLSAPPASLGEGDACVAVLDAGRLRFPLTARPWRDGDRLRPLGMDGHALVSDLLTDAKVPASARRRVPVVCSQDQVVWVAGHRLAESAKVRPATRRVVRLTFEPAEALPL